MLRNEARSQMRQRRIVNQAARAIPRFPAHVRPPPQELAGRYADLFGYQIGHWDSYAQERRLSDRLVQAYRDWVTQLWAPYLEEEPVFEWDCGAQSRIRTWPEWIQHVLVPDGARVTHLVTFRSGMVWARQRSEFIWSQIGLAVYDWEPYGEVDPEAPTQLAQGEEDLAFYHVRKRTLPVLLPVLSKLRKRRILLDPKGTDTPLLEWIDKNIEEIWSRHPDAVVETPKGVFTRQWLLQLWRKAGVSTPNLKRRVG